NPVEVEEQVPQDDGVHTYISLKFPLRDSRGGSYAVCGISTDITARKRTEEVLRQSALGVSGAGGDDIFAALVSYCANALGVDYAYIALPCVDDPGRLRTIALHARGHIVENLTYDLAGTPCADVVGGEFHFYPRDIQQLFPGDNMASRLSVQSYAAFPLTGSHGRALGLIGVMHGQPLANDRLVESMLKIFAARAVAELEHEQGEAARRASEEALRASEERYHTIFNASVDGLALCTPDGRIMDANPAFCHLHGYTREELLSAESFQFVHPDSHLRCWAFFEAASAGHNLSSEAKAQRKDGTFFAAEAHGVPVHYGHEPHLLLIMRDITKNKLAEQQLADREEQYRVMFNATSDGMALWTIDGKLVDVNQACCNLHGMTREQLLKAPLTEFVPPESMPKLMQLLATVREGRAYQDEAIATHKNGQVFHLDMRGVPATFQGKRHVLLVLRDITEAKKKEEELRKSEAQLRQAQKMEAIGHLTGGVAHDFNNILTAVMGYVAMAQERAAEQGDERLDKYLERALRSGRQARDLIQQMLTFSRGQRGEPRALALAPLIKESVKLMRSTLPSSIEFETDLDTAVPAVLLDPVQLEQVLMNLCINARDAMQGAGTLHIALARTAPSDGVCTSCHQPVRGSHVELVVRDSGAGIAPEVVERMFEPFFTTKEVGKGSGMGLSTVHGIVHEHGGHVIVETAPGAGATFRVLLKPMSRAEGANGVEEAEPAGDTAELRRLNGRVLLVDDEPAVSEFMAELLESWGLDVVVKRNGVEAEALVADDPGRFDLVVTDQTMPKMTGLELARRLAQIRPELPVVLYTGYSERLTEELTRSAGIRALVTKPIDIAAFFTLVREIMK
ncbi:MAG: PAS domain S-box protein, partial [Bacteroidota bacterium]